MSIKAMSWSWQTVVKGNQKLVLLALADHANDDGDCWPGLKGIAKKCGVTERAIIKYINELIKAGLLSKRNQFDKNGRQKTNIYTLNMSNLGVNVVQGEDEQYSGGRVNNVHPKHHIETSIETNNICEVASQPSPLPMPISKPKSLKKQKTSEEVLEIFQYWQQVMSHPRAMLDDKRKRKIMQALKPYSVEELKRAIDGCANSPFNMGKNENGQRYDDIELILRDAKHIEQFINASSIVHLQKPANNKSTQSNNLFAGAI